MVSLSIKYSEFKLNWKKKSNFCMCIYVYKFKIACEKQSYSITILNICNDFSIWGTPRSLWGCSRHLNTYYSTYLNHPEKNNLLISCFSSLVDANICMCLWWWNCVGKKSVGLTHFPFLLIGIDFVAKAVWTHAKQGKLKEPEVNFKDNSSLQPPGSAF